MPTIEANGIKIQADLDGHILRYKVLDQSKDATKIMTILRQVPDPDGSKYTMRTNRHPSFKKSTGVFFLRGTERDKNEKEVVAEFDSSVKATNAYRALERLIHNVKMPEGIDIEHADDKEPLPGGTTHVRMAFITKNQAKILGLTAKNYYKDERVWPGKIKPPVSENAHWNEHIAQIVDVLNKSVSDKKTEGGVINGHRVDGPQAQWSVDAVRKLIDTAEQNGCLIAVWRILSGLRGPDWVDRKALPSTHR